MFIIVRPLLDKISVLLGSAFGIALIIDNFNERIG